MNLAQWMIPALAFLSVVGVVLGVAQLSARRSQLRERLRVAGGPAEAAIASVDADASTALRRLAEPLARLATPQDEEEITRFRARFMNAGIRSRSAPSVFFAAKVLLALTLPLLVWLVVQFGGWRSEGNQLLAGLVIAAGAGYYLPNLVLSRLVEQRQRELFEAFPDAMDLMIVCVEAGLALDMAIQRAGSEMALRSRALAEELALVGTELRIGSTRERALRNLALRTGVEEISMFVAMLLQADRFGTSIAESLRIHAEELRVRRQLRAEEHAAKVPIKLLFPLLLFIFPSLLVVIVGPAGIQVARQLLPTLGGGQ